MRTTLMIDDDVLAAARGMARSEGRSVGSVLSALARRGLRATDAAMREDDDGIPVFDVPPDAPVFGPEEVTQALDES